MSKILSWLKKHYQTIGTAAIISILMHVLIDSILIFGAVSLLG